MTCIVSDFSLDFGGLKKKKKKKKTTFEMDEVKEALPVNRKVHLTFKTVLKNDIFLLPFYFRVTLKP